MREKDEKIFVKALNNLAKGEMFSEDIFVISSRITNENGVPNEEIRLYSQNKLVDMYNERKINESDQAFYNSFAIDHILGKVDSKKVNI